MAEHSSHGQRVREEHEVGQRGQVPSVCRLRQDLSSWKRSARRSPWRMPLFAPPIESFTGVIGRAGLDQGRGVLSRVTSASMLLSRSLGPQGLQDPP